MAKKISSKDIFEKEDIFIGIRKSAKETIEMMKLLKREVEGTAKKLQSGFGAKPSMDSAKQIEKIVKVSQQANKLKKESIQIDKLSSQAKQQEARAVQELEKIQQQKLRTQQQQMRVDKQQRQEKERLQKVDEKRKKTIADEANAYKKLEKQTRKLKNESKRLGAMMLELENSGKKNSKEYRKLSEQYKKVTKSAQAGDRQLKKLDKTVGDNFRNVGNYVGALNLLKNGLAQLGLAFGVGTVVRGGIDAIVEFDQAVADLSAITGASGKDLEFFKKQANELGIEVEGGATAVVEAYKLIGSAKPELLSNARALNELTKSAITLSQASGMELPEASKALTDAMNQFGASASQAGKFIDVLASGAKFGSAEIPQITEALLKFGAVAKSTNVSVQESTGAIELLAEHGIKGTEAGTKLRNVMLKLSAPDALPREARDIMKEMGISFEDLTDKSKPFEKRLEALKPLLENGTGLVKVFGVENEVAGQVLLENTERLGELTKQMDTNGVAQEQARKRTNTLGHALTKLKNSFLSLFTNVASGEGSMQTIINTLKWIANNLPRIIVILGKLIRTYVLYRTTLIAVNKIQWLYNGGLNEIAKSLLKNIKGTRAYKLEQIKLARATKDTTRETSAMGRSLKSLGLMAVIGLVSELAIRWYDVASGARNARLEAESYAKAEMKAQEKVGKAIQYWREVEQNDLMDIEESVADNLKTEEEANQARINVKKNIIKQLENEKSMRAGDLKIVQNYVKVLKDIDKKFKAKEMTSALWTKQNKTLANLNTALETFGFDSGYTTGTVFISNLMGEATGVEQILIKAQSAVEQVSQETQGYNKEIQTLTNEARQMKIEMKNGNKQFTKYTGTLSSTKKSVHEINTAFTRSNEYISKQTELLQELTELEQDRVLLAKDKSIEEEYEAQLRSIADTGEFDATELNRLIQDRVETEKLFIDERMIYEQNALDAQYKREKQARKDQLKERYDALIKGAEGNAEAIKKIDANYEVEKDKLAKEEIKREEDVATQKNIIYKEAVNEKLEAEENGFESLTTLTENLTQEVADAVKDTTAKTIQTIEEIIRASADLFIQQSNRKIQQMDKEIQMAEKQYDHFKALAEQGNIDAEKSLAEQQEIINKKNKEKLEEQKRQQRLQLGLSVFQAYSSKVESGVENPVAETIRDTSLLLQFIQSIPAFFEGIEDTGKNGQGVDGKGGFHAILHPNERVIPKSLNDQIGQLTNEELTRIAVNYKNSSAVDGANQTTSALDLAVLVNELSDIKQTIKNKPETNIELGQITSSMMEIVQKTKKGNSLTYNRYKVSK